MPTLAALWLEKLAPPSKTAICGLLATFPNLPPGCGWATMTAALAMEPVLPRRPFGGCSCPKLPMTSRWSSFQRCPGWVVGRLPWRHSLSNPVESWRIAVPPALTRKALHRIAVLAPLLSRNRARDHDQAMPPPVDPKVRLGDRLGDRRPRSPILHLTADLIQILEPNQRPILRQRLRLLWRLRPQWMRLRLP